MKFPYVVWAWGCSEKTEKKVSRVVFKNSVFWGPLPQNMNDFIILAEGTIWYYSAHIKLFMEPILFPLKGTESVS